MEPDSHDHLQFEIGHVLFIDIVGYSKLLIEEQREALNQLSEIVLGTPQVKESPDERVVKLPTGDGMALVFRHSSEEPARCALEVAEALRRHPEIPVRMGIHSGPVSEVTDVSGRTNIAGAGINMAQRVMDCGDAGHILLSQRVAEDLAQYRQWAPRLHDLGECEVKHGVRLHLVNLYAEQIGNPSLPAKFKRAAGAADGSLKSEPARKSKLLPIGLIILGILLLCLVIVGLIFAPAVMKSFSRSRAPSTPPAPPPVPSAPAAPVPEKSIAVLPFENLSDDKANTYFADGVQDEILTDLAKIADLKVISRTSVMQFKDAANRNLREIGRALGVANVLEGSVQRAGNRVRVNAQLIDARNDAHLWAQTFDRDLADVFAIQSEIAKAIADQLQARLSPKEKAEMEAKPTQDMVAYDLYLRAIEIDRNAVTSGPSVEPMQRAIPLLEEAVRRDPNFIPALAALARNHLYLYWQGDHSTADLEAAQRAIEQAAALEPDSGEVHRARALYRYWGERDYDAALRELALAQKELPNDSDILFLVAMIERRQGKFAEAREKLEKVVAADPRNIRNVSEVATTEVMLNNFPAALRAIDQMLTWRPGDFELLTERAFFHYVWKADLTLLDQVTSGDAVKNASPTELASVRFWRAILHRDFHAAGDALATGNVQETDFNALGYFIPREWMEAMVAEGLGDRTAAQTKLLAARERAARFSQERPSSGMALIVVAQIDAALGRKDEAIREGQRAVEIFPVAKDAILAPKVLCRLAAIYARVGERDRAFELLDKLVAVPDAVHYGELKLEPAWDPLRDDPRFAKLLDSLAPNESK
jgi:TolB-like protein/lipopolysaccharide biosynthesis regulator YciM